MRRRALVLWIVLLMEALVPLSAMAEEPRVPGFDRSDQVASQDAGVAAPIWLLLTALFLITTAGTVEAVSGEIERRRAARAWRIESMQLWPRRPEDAPR